MVYDQALRILLACWLACSGLTAYGQSSTRINGLDASAALSDAQKELIFKAMQAYPAGVQAAIALLDGDTILWTGALCMRDTIRPIDNRQSVFEIGSITKVFTATLLAELAAAGQLGLDDALATHLDFPLKGQPSIRLRQLANHSAGLPRLPGNLGIQAMLSVDNPYRDYHEDKLRDYLSKKLKLESRPGERYNYSNLGSGLLGYTLERISGQSYEQLIQTYFAARYGMRSLTADRSKAADRLVKGLDRSGRKTSNWDLGALAGAGALLASVEDLTRFAQAHFDPQNATLALTRESSLEIDKNMRMGLGWHLIQTARGNTWAWHNGGTGGYRSSMTMDVAARKAVVILTNISAFHPKADEVDTLGFDLMRSLY